MFPFDWFWLQRLTGGLVIWRAGSAAVVYRGKDYVHPFVLEREEKELLSLDLDEDEEQELLMEAGSEVEMESSIEECFDVTGDQSGGRASLGTSVQSMRSAHNINMIQKLK